MSLKSLSLAERVMAITMVTEPDCDYRSVMIALLFAVLWAGCLWRNLRQCTVIDHSATVVKLHTVFFSPLALWVNGYHGRSKKKVSPKSMKQILRDGSFKMFRLSSNFPEVVISVCVVHVGMQRYAGVKV